LWILHYACTWIHNSISNQGKSGGQGRENFNALIIGKIAWSKKEKEKKQSNICTI